MHNSISGLTSFTYFRIIVSLEVTVGVSSHKPKVRGPFCVMLSSFFRLFSFWGRLHFWGHLNFWGRLHFLGRFHFWGCLQCWGRLSFRGRLHFWGCLQCLGQLHLWGRLHVWSCFNFEIPQFFKSFSYLDKLSQTFLTKVVHFYFLLMEM